MFPSIGAQLINWQWHTLAPPFNSGANAATVSVQTLPVQCHYSAGTDVGRGSLETTGNRLFDIMSHVGLMELPLAIVTLGIIRPHNSGAAFEQKVSECLGMPEGKSPRHTQNPLLVSNIHFQQGC